MNEQNAIEAAATAMARNEGDVSADAKVRGLTTYRDLAREALAAADELAASRVEQLEAALQSERIDMVHELITAIYGSSWARPQSPEWVWNFLLDRVRDLVKPPRAEIDAETESLIEQYAAIAFMLGDHLDSWEDSAPSTQNEYRNVMRSWLGLEEIASADEASE